MSIYRLEALFQKSRQMSNPKKGEVQKCQQEASGDTKPALGERGCQRQGPDKRQPGATAPQRLAGPGHRRAVDENFGHCFAADTWR